MQTRWIEIIKVPKADDGFPLLLKERKMFLGLRFPIRRPKSVHSTSQYYYGAGIYCSAPALLLISGAVYVKF